MAFSQGRREREQQQQQRVIHLAKSSDNAPCKLGSLHFRPDLLGLRVRSLCFWSVRLLFIHGILTTTTTKLSNYNVRLGAFVRLCDDLIGSNVGAALARDNPAICLVQYTTAAGARPDETAGRSDGRSAERRGKGSGASCREKKGDVGFLASQPASWLLPRSRCGAAVYLSVCLSPSILFMLYCVKWVESPYFSFICFWLLTLDWLSIYIYPRRYVILFSQHASDWAVYCCHCYVWFVSLSLSLFFSFFFFCE